MIFDLLCSIFKITGEPFDNNYTINSRLLPWLAKSLRTLPIPHRSPLTTWLFTHNPKYLLSVMLQTKCGYDHHKFIGRQFLIWINYSAANTQSQINTGAVCIKPAIVLLTVLSLWHIYKSTLILYSEILAPVISWALSPSRRIYLTSRFNSSSTSKKQRYHVNNHPI